MKVTICFNGDTSVGIFPYSYSMDIPEFEPEYREYVRSAIKILYIELDGEFTPHVFFEDENFD